MNSNFKEDYEISKLEKITLWFARNIFTIMFVAGLLLIIMGLY